jgi:hypothetical protein
MAFRWNIPGANKLTGQDIIARVRMKVSDSLVNKYSDHEILMSLNEGIDYLWQALAKHYSTITHKVREYTLASERPQLLPDDYNTLVSVKRKDGGDCKHVHIAGLYIFGEGWVRLTYGYYPRDVSLPGDTIDIPTALIHDLVAIVSNILTTNIDGALRRADEAAKRVSQFREYGPIPQLEAFP